MLLQLVNEKNYASIRFESPDEVRQATLGEPLQFFARRSLYPVEAKQRVASSIIVSQSCDGWRATDFGNAAVARAITRYRKCATEDGPGVQRPAEFVYPSREAAHGDGGS